MRGPAEGSVLSPSPCRRQCVARGKRCSCQAAGSSAAVQLSSQVGRLMVRRRRSPLVSARFLRPLRAARTWWRCYVATGRQVRRHLRAAKTECHCNVATGARCHGRTRGCHYRWRARWMLSPVLLGTQASGRCRCCWVAAAHHRPGLKASLNHLVVLPPSGAQLATVMMG